MTFYRYHAMDDTGRVRRGRIAAPSPAHLEAQLKRMGLDLITCKRARGRSLPISSRGSIRRELINFCFQLEQLTSAGVPLLHGLAELRDTIDDPPFREVVSTAIERIAEGATLSAALEEAPQVFDPVFVNLVRAGERSGRLPSVLNELTETLKWQDELSARAYRVLIVPAFTGLVVGGVFVFLMTYVTPQLVEFIHGMHGTLPLHTRVLLAISHLFGDYWGLLLATPPLLFAGCKAMAQREPSFRLRVDAYKLGIWLVGDILRKLILARFARIFALMYRSGIPVLDILQMCGRLVNNAVIEQAIDRARDHIAQGECISRAFERTALFPPLVLRMISVGESTGALDRALINVSYFYDRDVKECVDKLEALMEPVMTVVLGILLGWIMLAVLGPIYDAVSQVRL